MSFRFILLILSTLFFLVECTESTKSNHTIPEEKPSSPVIDWVFDDAFTSEEQEMLKRWILLAHNAAQEVLGPYPFDTIPYHFHREDSSMIAVLFGHTDRKGTSQGAHFYVDPSFPEEEFTKDWIAPHEISHLALPKLLKKDSWFYEGFATYISRSVMIEMGTQTREECDSTYYARISQIKGAYQTTSSMIVAADSLRSAHYYSAHYWGGAIYFHQADLRLKAAGKITVSEVVKQSQPTCNDNSLKLDELIQRYDEISESHIFSELLEEFRTIPARDVLAFYPDEVCE